MTKEILNIDASSLLFLRKKVLIALRTNGPFTSTIDGMNHLIDP
jgi:hypothetical protein